METHESIAHNEDAARTLIAALVSASAWFEVTPLPDDEWRIRTKAEAHLTHLAETLTPGGSE